jgi:hypothetical protein
MKVFADGAMYSKKAEWSDTPEHVVLEVGGADIPPHELIRYSLSTPGIHTAIIGIGKINDQIHHCQLAHNLIGAQVLPGEISQTDRIAIEALALKAKGGKTNYFQKPHQDLTPPNEAKLVLKKEGEAEITWHTAYAGDAAIERYEIWRDDQLVMKIPYTPQTTKLPFRCIDNYGPVVPKNYVVKVVDTKNRVAEVKAV